MLVDANGLAKIADFGVAEVHDQGSSGISTTLERGSLRWMAPELLEPEHFGLEKFCRTPQSDTYSFGCVILEVTPFTKRKTQPR